jgi:hypothetical protein
MARRSVVRRVKGMRVVRLFRRVRLPLAILLVIDSGVDSAFDSQKRASRTELVRREVKAEKISISVNPYTQCLARGA